MASKTYVRMQGQMPTAEQLNEVKRAAELPLVYDDDSPKLTAAQLSKFKRVSEREAGISA